MPSIQGGEYTYVVKSQSVEHAGPGRQWDGRHTGESGFGGEEVKELSTVCCSRPAVMLAAQPCILNFPPGCVPLGKSHVNGT